MRGYGMYQSALRALMFYVGVALGAWTAVAVTGGYLLGRRR